jgi:hypothetical protein
LPSVHNENGQPASPAAIAAIRRQDRCQHRHPAPSCSSDYESPPWDSLGRTANDEWGVDVSDDRLALRRSRCFRAGSVQCGQREGNRGVEDGPHAACVLGLGADAPDNKAGFFPYTPSTNLLYGLREAIKMLMDEGLESVFARHERFGRATRAAVKAWGLDIVAQNPDEYSGVLTAVMMPEGRDADAFRQVVLERFDMSLGTGLGKLKGRVFRIGHLGDFNDLMLTARSAVSRWASRWRRPAQGGRRSRRAGHAGERSLAPVS